MGRVPAKFIQLKPGGGLIAGPTGLALESSSSGDMEAGIATLDFGTTGSYTAKVAVIGQAAIVPSSCIFVSKRLVDIGDSKAIETLIRDVELGAMNIQSGVGFEILAVSRKGKQKGILQANWFWY